MKCPYCADLDNRVIDSRLSQGGEVTRRRRECAKCTKRYTTYERVEEWLPLVVKKDGRREPFPPQVLVGLKKACEKRPVPAEQIEAVADGIERDLAESADKEIASTRIGERVMAKLREVDEVAYVRLRRCTGRFATSKFMDEMNTLLRGKSGATRVDEVSEIDASWMQRAVALGWSMRPSPNPRVGSVVVKDGEV